MAGHDRCVIARLAIILIRVFWVFLVAKPSQTPVLTTIPRRDDVSGAGKNPLVRLVLAVQVSSTISSWRSRLQQHTRVMAQCIISVCMLALSVPSYAANLIVSHVGGDFQSLGAAIGFLSANNSGVVPKFDSRGQSACFFGKETALSTYVYGTSTNWTQDVSPGDLIALKGSTKWYRVVSINADNSLRIARPDEADEMACGDYDVVEMDTITVMPGVYKEASTIDMGRVPFLQIKGVADRDAVVIVTADGDQFSHAAINTFQNYPDVFVHVYENITIQNLETGGIVELNPNAVGNDTELVLRNVVLDRFCCDTIYGYGKLGHLAILDSLLTGGGDTIASGIRGSLKGLIVRNSIIRTKNMPAHAAERVSGGALLNVTGSAVIQDSRFACRSYTAGDVCVKVGETGPAGSFVISNTDIVTVGGLGGAYALSVNGGAQVKLVNVRIQTQASVGVDIQLGSGSEVSIECGRIDNNKVVNKGGVVTDLGCAQ